MNVTLVTNAAPTSGVGKPVGSLRDGLEACGQEVSVVTFDNKTRKVLRQGRTLRSTPRFPWGKPFFWLYAGLTFPLPPSGLIHFTNQTLSFAVSRAPERSLVTVWDLIELRKPQEPGGRFFARTLYRGIPRAAHVIACSQATAEDIRAEYRVPDERLSVIPPNVSPYFRPVSDPWQTDEGRAFRALHRLGDATPLILYVGSEHRRKNLRRLLEAFAMVRATMPDARFVKVGAPGIRAGRAELVATVTALKLWPAIQLVEESNDRNLRWWYHAATVLAFPSLYEGFGFPPLEAMACGTPVVTSNRSSLPEVVGDAAVTVNPEHTEEIAAALSRVLSDARLRSELRQRGLARAAQFTRERTVAATLAVYAAVLRSGKGAR